jgi:uncharacterized protein (TIGR01777 family)
MPRCPGGKLDDPMSEPENVGAVRYAGNPPGCEEGLRMSSMRVFITGGSGLIGFRLAKALLDDGHEPVILSRNADAVRRRREMWPFRIVPGDPSTSGRWENELDGCDAVVNLAGHNLFAERWTSEVKRKMRDSRVHSAEQLSAAIKKAHNPPRIFIQGSAVGFYGAHGDEEFDESGASGSDFLAVICRETEEASAGLEQIGVRRAWVRTGIVLAPEGGALKLMMPLFKLAPGAPIGAAGKLVAQGNQWMSWIHIDDIVGLFRLALENSAATGPLNGTAPQPVRNAEFARTLSSVLYKPYAPWRVYVPFGPPDGLLRLVLGEVASVITTGQRVVPAKALALGYVFKYPHLADALHAIVEESAPKPPEPVHAAAGSHH